MPQLSVDDIFQYDQNAKEGYFAFLRSKQGLKILKMRSLWDHDLVRRKISGLIKFVVESEQMEGVGPLDLTRIGDWITKARQSYNRAQATHRSIRLDTSAEIPSNENMDDLIANSDAGKYLRRIYGPHLRLRDFAKRFEPTSEPKPLSEGERFVQMRTDRIMSLWNEMRGISLAQFNEAWLKTTPHYKKNWLSAYTPSLPPSALLRLLAIDSPRHAYLAPLLNVQDLAYGNNLPDLLWERTTHHPSLFKRQDISPVSWSIWTGQVPVPSYEGFASVVSSTFGDYQIRFMAKQPENLGLDPLAHILLMLEGQERTYHFLLWCLKRTSPRLEAPSETIHSIPPTSLIEKATFSSYNALTPPDMTWVQSLLDTALEDAWADLMVLRSEPGLWEMRIRPLPAKGRSISLLRDAFARIENFAMLIDYAERASNSMAGVERVPEAQDDVRMNSFSIALDVVFSNILASLNSVKWKPRQQEDSIEKMMMMILGNDPAVRVVGCLSLLRFIQPEIEKNEHKTPPRVMYMFNDLSVLCACQREISKLLNSVLDSETISRYLKLEEEWTAAYRSWTTLALLLKERAGSQRRWDALDRLVDCRDVGLADRHKNFWAAVDRETLLVAEEMTTKEQQIPEDYISIIEKQCPNGSPQQCDATDPKGMSLGQIVEQPTSTQQRRSKGRSAPQISLPQQSHSNAKASDCRPRVVKQIQRSHPHWEFWTRLRYPHQNHKGQYTFHEFISAMSELGYEIIPQGGSGYRFVYKGEPNEKHAITFHDLHGERLSLSYARKLWLDRLDNRMELIVEPPLEAVTTKT